MAIARQPRSACVVVSGLEGREALYAVELMAALSPVCRAAFLRPPARLASRTLREKQALTQRDLAKQAKVTEVYVAVIETGVRKNPSLAILKRLAKALAVPVTALFE